MNNLLDILNDIIAELDHISDEELNARFEAAKGGAVGYAMAESRSFIAIEEFVTNDQFLDMELINDSEFLSENKKLNNVQEDASNDPYYLMAA